MTRFIPVVLLMLLAAAPASAAIKGEEIQYKSGGVAMRGYIAWDDAIKGKRPGVLVVHEWWGHNDYARRRARMLAELGYTALALDMYGEGKQAHHPDDAGKMSGVIGKNLPLARKRFDAARAALTKHASVDPKRIAAIGYCFGGTVVLQMARLGEPLVGVASFHGNLATDAPAKPGMVKARVLVLTGADDPFVPPEQVEAFRKEMDAAGAKYEVVVYPGAKHSFTNPDADEYGRKFNLPLAYNESADKESWAALKKFLAEIM
jgi:dienelactone hydrolase